MLIAAHHLAQGLGRRREHWDHNLICLGDFNIDRRGGALWQAFTSTGLTVPEQIDRPRVIAGKPLDHYYDQVAWFTEDDGGAKPLLSLRHKGRAGMRERELSQGSHRGACLGREAIAAAPAARTIASGAKR
jgi:hypothetical protein